MPGFTLSQQASASLCFGAAVVVWTIWKTRNNAYFRVVSRATQRHLSLPCVTICIPGPLCRASQSEEKLKLESLESSWWLRRPAQGVTAGIWRQKESQMDVPEALLWLLLSCAGKLRTLPD